MVRIYLYDKIQSRRIKPLINTSKKYNIFEKFSIKLVNLNEADLILFLVNSRNNIINLNQTQRNILFNTSIPKIIIERLDSSVTWVRNLDGIKNLKGIIKNRVVRNPELNNSELFYGRIHYRLMYDEYIRNNGNVNFKEKDLSNSFYKNIKKLPRLEDKYLNILYPVLWDFHSSPLGNPCLYFRNKDINFNNKSIDVFCVNREKVGIQGWGRRKATEIINNIKYIKAITTKLDKNKYNETVLKSKICVACWGWGEWIHLDGSAMYAGCILIKPDTGYVKMDPDIYKNNITYISCNPDFSNLEEVINKVLSNYDSYKDMIIKNRNMLLKLNKKDVANNFWNKIMELYNNKI